MGNQKRPHHQGAHQRRAAAVRDWAATHPGAQCATCGQPLERCGPNNDGRNRNGTPCTWDAGHIVAGDSTAGYQLECSACNRSAGATLGNARRATGYDWP